MRSAIAPLAVLVVLGSAASPAGAARHQPAPKRCASLRYDGPDGYSFFASTSIRATRVRCATARKVARVDPQTVAGKGSQPRRFRSRGFVCRGRRAGAVVRFRCTRRTPGTITFTWKVS